MAIKKDDLETTHIYESGYEFQCDECRKVATTDLRLGIPVREVDGRE